MRKIDLEIVALSHSLTQQSSYAVVLGEVDGVRRLPIVIGGFEAQAIAVALEKMKPSRPLTHDLMKNFFNAFAVNLTEVIINDLQEGIFYAKLICTNEHETVEIDSRTSDAIALAVRMGCTISTYDHILDSAGIILEGTTSTTNTINELENTETRTTADNLGAMPLHELKQLLTTVLEQEDYIRAVAIRDEINSRSK